MADTNKRLEVAASPPKLKLTVSDALDELPIAGVWSRGPVYQPLDPGFLAQPRIPKAPPTPRLQIDRVNGSLRVIDGLERRSQRSRVETTARVSDSETYPNPSPLAKRQRTLARFSREKRYQILALVIGFSAGIIAAMLLDLL